ncbi:MAG: hypothetical protein H7X95_12865 [Deltaproteobacteria bacterium]|nr:hypothetical protein [Deltaproteobacteria bacterium]
MRLACAVAFIGLALTGTRYAYGQSQPSLPSVSTPTPPAHSGYPLPIGAGPAPVSEGPDGTHGPDGTEAAPLVPPHVEGDPRAFKPGSYCYVGPHPVDTRVVPGPSWDATEGQHMRPYPPLDLRLFAFRDGCYYFNGDPRDFGYGGATFPYYGAHPVLDTFGGGWCFMMGGHTHLWKPWSPYFAVVGQWNYWQGPYDPFFWAYWRYFATYYRSYYPHFYGGGRLYQGGGFHIAPPIRDMSYPGWRGMGPGRAPPTIRGMPPRQMVRPPGAGHPRPPSMGGDRRGHGQPGFDWTSRPMSPRPHGSFRGGDRH